MSFGKISKGKINARRFRVLGELPEGFRETFRENLESGSFKEISGFSKDKSSGWVIAGQIMDTSFEDLNRWYLQPYIVAAIRTDQKKFPTILFKATIKKKADEWKKEHAALRCPHVIKKQLKENLQEEWAQRCLPRVTVTEMVWDTENGFVLLFTKSEKEIDLFRRMFFKAFGLKITASHPLDALSDKAADKLSNVKETNLAVF